ncbi:MAG: response regulator [Spirochaetales bacterium]|nr:response regulator [Spirochaetales bacterium]
MQFKSISAKLLLLMLGTYIISLFSILLISDRQLHRILDKSQSEIYREKLEIIVNELERTENRLQRTGLVEAYFDDFKNTLLKNLTENYYTEEDPGVYPFIVDSHYSVILHPVLGEGDLSFLLSEGNSVSPLSGSGEFTAVFQDREQWFIYQEFAPWDWLVFYTVPLSEKYRDGQSFMSMLMVVLFMLAVVLLPVLALILYSFVRPIVQLTEISQKMAEGYLNHPVDIRSRDEIGVLARSFESMQGAVKQKIEDLNHEIQERKKIEGELERARNYIFSVIDSMPSVIIGIDREGQITQWNSRAEELTGLPSVSAMGRPVDEVLPFPDIDLQNIKSGVQKGIVQYYPQQFRTEGEMTFYDDITIYPLKNTDDMGAVIRIDDVTEKTVLEEQLVQAQKMDAIGQLAGGVAHDFNNMLAGITGAASLMKSLLNQEDKSAKYLDLILDASGKAADLTAKLLSFGRKNRLSSSLVNIHEVINGTLALLERTLDRKIEIIKNPDAEKAFFTGDFSALQNTIMNLSINASHAMEDGGELRVSTRNLFLDDSFCRLSPFDLIPGEYIEVTVADTGVGIASKDLGKIFEPFYTTKSQGSGTGLGLSSVYGTMQNLKGAVRVESEVGRGTSFHLYLPCSEEASETVEKKKTPLKKGSGTILLVEDEEVIRQTTAPLLKNLGYTVILAEDGEDGLVKFRENQDRISLVISDMIMPRMNGKELFYKIQEIGADCPFIIASGYTKDENLNEMKKHGLSGFLQKPFLADELGELLDSIIH